jgi:SIR2-like domain
MGHWLEQNTVFIFGAGATKACGGPLTADILPAAFGTSTRPPIQLASLAVPLEECLVRHFHIPENVSSRERDDYPPLPLVLSLLDLAIDQDRPLSFRLDGNSYDNWDHERLSLARKAIEYVIFAVLDEYLDTMKRNFYEDLFDMICLLRSEPCAISLNYDILLDSVLFRIAEKHRGPDAKVAYCCDIQTDAYRTRKTNFGRLMKLHGSLNWLYCPCCRRLDLATSDCAERAVSCSILHDLVIQNSLDEHYHTKPKKCPECTTPMRAVMITPTRAKDYRNPHIQGIWYEAERALRRAEHVCFVGYSLPDDDLEVIDLLRRGLGHLPPSRITVVEYDDRKREISQHPVGRRYQSMFGDKIEWRVGGFEGWLAEVAQTA